MKAAIALLLLCLAGCVTAPAHTPRATAGLGQAAYTNGLTVRPVRVVEDSRCARNVVCIWAGRLVVRTEIKGQHLRETHDLELGKSQPIADGSLTLMSVSPAKHAEAEIDPRSYRFTFDFRDSF